MKIDSKEISVIIQGPIFNILNSGSEYTLKSILSVRKYLPDSEIILSTWKQDYDISSYKIDKLVMSDDPGGISMKLNKTLPYNLNRQILSTKNGLMVATRKYVVKLRSDSVLVNSNFLNYFSRFNIRTTENNYFSRRVLTCSISSFNPSKKEKRLFNASDWFFFGYKEDIQKIFDIPFQQKTDLKRKIEDNLYDHKENLSVEQYIWTSLIKKSLDIKFDKIYSFSLKFKCLSEHFIANNLIILSPKQLGIESFKYKYNSEFVKYMECFYYYSYYDWIKLYSFYVSKKTNYVLLIKNLKYSFFFLLISYKFFKLIHLFKTH